MSNSFDAVGHIFAFTFYVGQICALAFYAGQAISQIITRLIFLFIVYNVLFIVCTLVYIYIYIYLFINKNNKTE